MSANVVNIIGATLCEQIVFTNLLSEGDYDPRSYRSSQDFFRDGQSNTGNSIVLAGIHGVDDAYSLMKEMTLRNDAGAMILFSHERPPASMIVEAMRAGASDFIDTPVIRDDLYCSLERAKNKCQRETLSKTIKVDVLSRLARLTVRENEILTEMRNGHPNKIIAYHLGISQRTVENHRANIMQKLGASNIAALMNMLAMANGMAAP